MLVRKLAPHVYDIFMGIGWPIPDVFPGSITGTWTRVRKFHWGVKPVAGAFVSRGDCREIFDAINANPNGNLGEV